MEDDDADLTTEEIDAKFESTQPIGNALQAQLAVRPSTKYRQKPEADWIGSSGM